LLPQPVSAVCCTNCSLRRNSRSAVRNLRSAYPGTFRAIKRLPTSAIGKVPPCLDMADEEAPFRSAQRWEGGADTSPVGHDQCARRLFFGLQAPADRESRLRFPRPRGIDLAALVCCGKALVDDQPLYKGQNPPFSCRPLGREACCLVFSRHSRLTPVAESPHNYGPAAVSRPTGEPPWPDCATLAQRHQGSG